MWASRHLVRYLKIKIHLQCPTHQRAAFPHRETSLCRATQVYLASVFYHFLCYLSEWMLLWLCGIQLLSRCGSRTAASWRVTQTTNCRKWQLIQVPLQWAYRACGAEQGLLSPAAGSDGGVGSISAGWKAHPAEGADYNIHIYFSQTRVHAFTHREGHFYNPHVLMFLTRTANFNFWRSH